MAILVANDRISRLGASGDGFTRLGSLLVVASLWGWVSSPLGWCSYPQGRGRVPEGASRGVKEDISGDRETPTGVGEGGRVSA